MWEICVGALRRMFVFCEPPVIFLWPFFRTWTGPVWGDERIFRLFIFCCSFFLNPLYDQCSAMPVFFIFGCASGIGRLFLFLFFIWSKRCMKKTTGVLISGTFFCFCSTFCYFESSFVFFVQKIYMVVAGAIFAYCTFLCASIVPHAPPSLLPRKRRFLSVYIE